MATEIKTHGYFTKEPGSFTKVLTEIVNPTDGDNIPYVKLDQDMLAERDGEVVILLSPDRLMVNKNGTVGWTFSNVIKPLPGGMKKIRAQLQIQINDVAKKADQSGGFNI